MTGNPFAVELHTGKKADFSVNQRPPTRKQGSNREQGASREQGPNIVSIWGEKKGSKIGLAVAPWGRVQHGSFGHFVTGYSATAELEYFELDSSSGKSVRVSRSGMIDELSPIEYQQGPETRQTGVFPSFGRQSDLAMRVESQVPRVRWEAANFIDDTFPAPKPFRLEGILQNSAGELCRVDLYEHRNWTADLYSEGVIIPWIWAERPLWLHGSGRLVIGLWRNGKIQLEELVIELN